MRAMIIGAALLTLSGGAEAAEEGMGRGQFHPDRPLPDLEGKPRRLSELAGGKKLIVFHFASW